MSENISNISFEQFETSINKNNIDEFSLIKAIIYSIIFLTGTIGNLIIILSVSINKELRSTTYIYLLNLSICDIIHLLSIPFTIITSVKKDWIFNIYVCKIFWLLNGINQFTSIALVSVVSIDR
jgi:C-X-C chemokine receptor type 4